MFVQVALARRRNSSLELLRARDGRMRIRKRYSRRYVVQDELDGYVRLSELLRGLEGVRAAGVVDVDEGRRWLDVEFVDGQTLAAALEREGATAASGRVEALVELFVRSHASGVPFDADPANMIVEMQSGELVLIDPVSDRLELRHEAVVVFLWGLMKVAVSPRSVLRLGEYRHTWIRIAREYCARVGCHEGELDREIARYLGKVVAWNLFESASEPLIKRLVRVLLFVPGMWCLGRAFALRGRMREARHRRRGAGR